MAPYTLPPQHSTVAQLSFGPATQQTVTTVTTTTTVSLPPLIMRPPKDLFERDVKQYPLAFSPTPKYLRRFCTDVNGMPIRFQEEEDARETVRKHRELQANIHMQGGAIRTEQDDKSYRTPVRDLQHSHVGKQVHNVRASGAHKRSHTPLSIAEAAELASLERKMKKPRAHLHRTDSELQELPSLNQRAASGEIPTPRDPSLITPEGDAAPPNAPARLHANRHARRTKGLTRPSQSRLQELQREDGESEDDVHMADSEYQEEDSQLGPPFYGGRTTRKRSHPDDHALPGASQTRGATTTTPPMIDAEYEDTPPLEEFRRPNLPNLVTSSQQDASLPSPSLSPITAAANLASRQNAFEISFGEHMGEDESMVPALDLEDGATAPNPSFPSKANTSGTRPEVPRFSDTRTHQPQYSSGPTVMDIPTMVDAFDSMPETMQTYIMYQLLRRCAKPTLQVVANVVNPALKCDPFNVLPVELGLNIVRYLDVQSMCRAAQVSKRWRRHINSDEKAWKDLFDRDGFVLPEGEIAKAVKEGWGWQHPGELGYEEDLSHSESKFAEESSSSTAATSVSSDDEEMATSSTVAAKLKRNGSKLLKRRAIQISSSATKPSTSTSALHVNRLLSSARGPNALANAAAQEVKHPAVGLPSLRSMHLFKSLYQRHYLIRKAWMTEDSQPQHLAFRAHHRHVVTCLLFDNENILTGSDDARINVYDTKTGALKNRLEGHEGGVWALQYDGDTLVSGSTDRSVRVWDIKTARCLQVFQGHTSTVRCLVILKPEVVDRAPDGTPIYMPKEPLIITGSRDSTLRVWKLPQAGDRPVYQTGQHTNDRDNPYFLRALSGHHNSVRAIAAHGDTLVSGSYDCTVRVWKISTGDQMHRLQGHTQKVYSVVLDHARNRCISGSMDNLVKVWDLQSGACLFNLEGHTSLVGLLDLSHDRLVSAAADSTLRIWDPESGVCKATLSAHTGAITCFQHDGQKIISGSDRALKMWNVRNGECVKDLLTDLSGVWQVRFDERRCIAAVQRNNLTYIEVLDFGAFRDGVPAEDLGRRIVVDCRGREIEDVDAGHADAAVPAAA
ncbi:WD40-repeat-containing domain protein [Neohortaea acidophila]|uniref:WD40-repeat-containing domain protein n=1 Tax=Neohortaea acidophila TaxID=245834 RepID=A0A6A6PFX0_9PEZI|nr:WD40-repeat-containing domain protein [Neohortaea acidophila]KAF2478543.1 WD40-repeat-containing domain protein [Neohortaea acidophila]